MKRIGSMTAVITNLGVRKWVGFFDCICRVSKLDLRLPVYMGDVTNGSLHGLCKRCMAVQQNGCALTFDDGISLNLANIQIFRVVRGVHCFKAIQ